MSHTESAIKIVAHGEAGPRAPVDAAWRLEPHICRVCQGRLVSRPADAPGERLYQCTNCGVEHTGRSHVAACCCGISFRREGVTTQTITGVLLCMQNERPTPEMPSLFVAVEVEAKRHPKDC